MNHLFNNEVSQLLVNEVNQLLKNEVSQLLVSEVNQLLKNEVDQLLEMSWIRIYLELDQTCL